MQGGSDLPKPDVIGWQPDEHGTKWLLRAIQASEWEIIEFDGRLIERYYFQESKMSTVACEWKDSEWPLLNESERCGADDAVSRKTPADLFSALSTSASRGMAKYNASSFNSFNLWGYIPMSWCASGVSVWSGKKKTVCGKSGTLCLLHRLGLILYSTQ